MESRTSIVGFLICLNYVMFCANCVFFSHQHFRIRSLFCFIGIRFVHFLLAAL